MTHNNNNKNKSHQPAHAPDISAPLLDYQRAAPPARRPARFISASGACGLIALLHALMAAIFALTWPQPAIATGAVATAFGAVGLLLALIVRRVPSAASPRLFIATILINVIAAAIAALAIGAALSS